MSQSRVEDVLPLSPLQEGLLFHALYAGEDGGTDAPTDVYNVQLTLTLDGPADPVALRAAMTALLRRHPQLRGAFRLSGSGRPVLVVPRAVTVPWTETDLTGTPPDEREERVRALADADRVRRFDAARAPLLRCRFIRTAQDRARFVLTYHHMLLDGWSMSLLVRELLALYTAGGADTGLPAPVPYRGYLQWLAGTDRETARKAWREALDGLDSATLLAPAGLPEQRALPGTVSTGLSEEETSALVALCRSRGLTLNTLVQAAWGMLLGHLTGQDDVVFGAITSGRPPEVTGVDSMIGLFINAVPVRVRLRPAESVAGLLDRLQSEQASLTGHQHLPLSEVVGTTGLRTLFDTLMVFESYPLDASALRAESDRAAVHGIDVKDATHYPLTLVVLPGRSLVLNLGHRTDLFTADAARSVLQRLTALLTALPAAADAPLASLRPGGAGQLAEELAGGAGTRRALPAETLPEILERQAARTPDAVAVRFEDRTLTYAALHERADRLARALAAAGAGPEQIVALALPRSVELVVALLAVLKTGAAFLPVAPDSAPGRLNLLLAEARPVAVVTPSGGPAADLPPGPTRIPADASGGPSDGPAPWRTAGLHPDHPAYLLYTSGSTGRPKGVLVPHRGIVNRLRWMQYAYGLTADDRVLQKTPAAFDVSVWEFLWPLAEGAQLVLAAPDGHRDPHYLAELIERAGVTTAHFVPSMLDVFLDALETPGPDGEPPARAAACAAVLRRIVASGEELSRDLVHRTGRTLGVPLHNLYGPTEASIDVTAWPCPPGVGTGPVPIGRPVWNTRALVLDSALRPAATGATGELYLGGVQLARGYLHRPGQTAERFVADPYGEPGDRLYRTGDLARRRPDGALEFVGRVDDQVKLRGRRVEPGETAAVLAAHPSVTRAAVVVRDEGPGGPRLVAYTVTADGGPPDQKALAAHCAAHLPESQRPSAVVGLDALPLTSNGKLDRAALPAPARPAAGPGRAARSPHEEVLCALFAEVLGVARMSIDDDFFEHGGHSLLATRLTGRIREVLGTDTTVQAMFRAPTPALLAEHLGAAGAEDDGLGPLLPLRATGKRPPLFCVHPAAGLGWPYAGLLAHIGREYPVHALQARGLTSDEPLPGTAREMAEEYVERIRSVQPHGPYHLLGWSFGGLIAHAMAGLLEERGEEVGLLAVMDAYPRFEGAEDHAPGLADVLTGLLAHAGLRPEDLGEGPPDLDRTLSALRDAESALGRLDREQLTAIVRVFSNNTRVQHALTPRPFGGDLLFFTATEGRGPGWPTVQDWQPYTGGRITAVDVACDHGSMSRPEPLAVIGRAIADRLRETAARRTARTR
ncbi:amino acid adenylation domain-containing protein [Streptomyces rubiginosohelvolus]|uniref:amino acid adenylation domain-containing protein n=1 Tax=Streptomyces rubiginosohelvolus TaxID=67362 RepID=UPI0033BD31D6